MSLTLQSDGYSLQSVGYSPGVLNPPYTGNSLEWWLFFIFNSVLCSGLCSARYKVSQTKNSVKIVSAINPVTMENMDNSHLQMYCREAMHRATANQHL